MPLGSWRWSTLRNGARALLLPLLAAVFAAVLFAASARFRDASEGFQPAVVVAGLVFGATLLAGWSVRRTCRKIFRDLGLHVAALREKPSSLQPPSCLRLGRDLDVAELAAPLQALADCYRQALEQVVETKEALEALLRGPTSATSAHGAETRPDLRRYPTFPFERSRQQMVGRLTPNFRWQTATPLLQQFLGQPMERLNGRSFLRVVHAEDRERVETALAKTLEEGENHNLVFRIEPPSASGEIARPDVAAFARG
ncbi:MAG: hypothetical protein HYS12_18390, partial [Planctomycetes bacterium]|nr:hypothetical protein [Planctomycetota bacterium]